MTIYSTLPLICSLIFAALGFFVLFHNPKTYEKTIFSILCFEAFCWQFLLFFSFFSSDPSYLDYLAKIAYLTITFIPFTFYHFIVSHLKIKKERWLVLLFYSLGVFLIALLWTDLFVRGHQKFWWGNFPAPGPLYPIFVISALVTMTRGLWLLVKALKNPIVYGFSKNQLYYIFVGLLLYYSCAVDFLQIYGASWYPISVFLFLASVSVICYAILRHRLMDIEVVIKKSLVYSITSSVVVGGFIIIIPPLEALCRWILGYTSQAIGILVAGTAGFIFIPVRNRVQNVVDRLFYKAKYDYRRELREFTRSLITIRDPDELSGLIVNRIGNAMKLTSCSLILREETNGGYRRKTLSGLNPPHITKEYLPENDFLVRLQKHWKRVMVREDATLMTPGNAKRFGEEMTAIGADLTAPLFSKGKLIGILSLGNKMSGHMFSDEDMDLLATLSDEAAIAIENATLYKKILDVKNYTESILTNMTSGVVTVDLDGKITAANEAARKFISLDSGWVGESVEILGGQFAQPLLKTLKENRHYSNYEIHLPRKENEFITIGLSTSPLKDLGGQKIGAIMVFNDLSDVKQMEEEVRRLDRLASLGTLAAGMAHEIKNPLSSIKTFTQLLPEKMDDPEFRGDFLALAQKEVDRIDYLVNQLLSFARPSKPQLQKTDILKVLEESLAIVENQIVKKKAKLTKEFAKDLPLIPVDERQIKQVFINIIVNALQAMEEGGSISLVTKLSEPKIHRGEEAEFFQILITDTGKGIPEDQLDKLFNPFFTTKHDGTGLGLAIVHRIVEDHHGFIEVSSKVGKGTTFTVNFPLGEAAASTSELDIRSKEKGYGFGLEKTA